MPDSFSDAAPRFYRLSGKAPSLAGGFLIISALGVGIMLGALAGSLEFLGHIVRFTKLIIIGEIIIAIGTGGALGFLIGRLCDHLHSRSYMLNRACAVLAAVAALYAAWIAWLLTFVAYLGNTPPVEIIYSPLRLIQFIRILNVTGSWTIFNQRPTGLVLAILWLAEAALIVGVALKFVNRESLKNVYCEQCKRWGNRRSLMQFQDTNHDELKSALLAQDFDVLSCVKPRTLDQDIWCNIAIEGCSKCDDTQTLTLERMVFKRLEKNQSKIIITPLIHRLMLTPEQTAKVVLVAASIPTEQEAQSDSASRA